MTIRRAILVSLLPLCLALAACSKHSTTGPAEDDLAGFESISPAEIAAASFLDDLTEEDRAAVREALRAAREEIHAIVARFRAGEITREEAQALVRDVHIRLVATLSTFLTEEQIERLLHRRPGHPRPPDLDLTEEQLREIQALREECRQAAARVREAVRAGEITAEEGRLRVRRIAHECRQRFCGILEPDQRVKVPFCRGPEDGRRGG